MYQYVCPSLSEMVIFIYNIRNCIISHRNLILTSGVLILLTSEILIMNRGLGRMLLSPMAESGDDHGGDDDPCATTHSSETSQSLFGILTHLDGAIFVQCVLIIVGAVIFIEHTFELLQKVTYETPFNNIVRQIQKELMIVGTTAFLFKVVINIMDPMRTDWFHAIEYSDLIVPMFSFSNCFVGIVLLFQTVKLSQNWGKSYRLHLAELLVFFFEGMSTVPLFHRLANSFFNLSVFEVEFRIINNIFCEKYRMVRTAFSFDEYVMIVQEKFIMSILNTHPTKWCVFLGIMLLTIPDDPLINIIGCSLDHDDPDYYECLKRNAVVEFILGGCFLLFMGAILAGISRYNVNSILRRRGILCIEDYAPFLHYMEEQNGGEEEAALEARLNKDDLMTLAVAAMAEKDKEKEYISMYAILLYMSPTRLLHQWFGVRLRGGRSSSSSSSSSSAAAAERYDPSSRDGLSEERKKAVKHILNMKSSRADLDNHNSFSTASFAAAQQSSPTPVKAAAAVTTTATGTPSHTAGSGIESESAKRVNLSIDVHGSPLVMDNNTRKRNEAQTPAAPQLQPHGRHRHSHGSTPEKDQAILSKLKAFEALHQKQNQQQKKNGSFEVDASVHRAISEAFFFSPEIFFEMVIYFDVFLALYWALWLTTFYSLADSSAYKLFGALPGLITLFLFMYSVHCAVILKALVKLDQDAMLQVLEETEAARKLGEEIRNKLLARLQLLGDPEKELFALFREIDSDGSDLLSRSEFEFLMRELDMVFSSKKWRLIYHEIDRNFDNMISFEEFFYFLFPDNTAAIEAEQQRMATVRKRARLASQKVATHRSTKVIIQTRVSSIITSILGLFGRTPPSAKISAENQPPAGRYVTSSSASSEEGRMVNSFGVDMMNNSSSSPSAYPYSGEEGGESGGGFSSKSPAGGGSESESGSEVELIDRQAQKNFGTLSTKYRVDTGGGAATAATAATASIDPSYGGFGESIKHHNNEQCEGVNKSLSNSLKKRAIEEQGSTSNVDLECGGGECQ